MTVRELIAHLELTEPYREVRIHVGDKCLQVERFEFDPEEPEAVIRANEVAHG